MPATAFAQPAAQPPPPKKDAPPPPKKAGGDAPADPTTKDTKAPTIEGPGAPAESSIFDKIFAEDWFAGARPTFEIHGYFRVRSELFFNFDLGRTDDPRSALWPRPISDSYDYIDQETGQPASNQVNFCGDDPLNPEPCDSFTQGGANTRLRVAPVLTISDNIRAFAQIDLFDNLVLGSTPEAYTNKPGATGGYEVVRPGGYVPIGTFATTQWAPTAGQTSVSDSILVKRAWGEYVSPVGTFRFGRMPNHWGLGMMYNAGDGLDQDYGSTVDRILFTTGIPSIELYFAGMWDFADEGATGGPYYGCQQNPTGAQAGCSDSEEDAQRYQLEAKRHDLIQSDDVWQWGLQVWRKREPSLEKLDLARGDVVVNGGFYGIYRRQSLQSFAPIGANPYEVDDTLVRRGYEAFVPDLWGELKWNKLRVALEAALVWGSIDNTVVRNGNNFDNPDVAGDRDDGWNLKQFGFVLESDFRAVEDRLRIDFDFGFASGDRDVEGIDGYGPGGLSASAAPLGGLDAQLTKNRTYSTFRFHPDYLVDQIFWRRIVGTVQSAYYFKPGIVYDVMRKDDGQRAGGGLNLVWSRAVQPVQAPGNEPDLAVELNTKIYYQGLAGTYDVEGNPRTGFYGQLDYSVMIPLQGLAYLPGEVEARGEEATSLTVAHMLRLYMGVLF